MTKDYAALTPGIRRADRILYTGIGLYVLLLGLAGFAQTFYLKPLMGGNPNAPDLTALIVVHAIAFSAWLLLAVAQPWLIAAGRYDLHRRYGPWGMSLGLLLIAIGIYTGAQAMSVGFRDLTDETERAGFFAIPFFSMVGFAFFLWLAWLARKSGEAHKRYIVLAHTNLLEAAAFRLLRTIEAPIFPTVLILTFLPILAGVAYDLATRRRVHPIYLWGGAITIGLAFFRHAIVKQPWWIDFASFVRDAV